MANNDTELQSSEMFIEKETTKSLVAATNDNQSSSAEVLLQSNLSQQALACNKCSHTNNKLKAPNSKLKA
ncbi:MAG: hypothetical protein A2033_16630 [Bacteroidetes bacterium GWA2_31_9]|nr:MAG: hypothetical protein A2033_16630 [Bacteroidetes bacterium GWA2_31_9]